MMSLNGAIDLMTTLDDIPFGTGSWYLYAGVSCLPRHLRRAITTGSTPCNPRSKILRPDLEAIGKERLETLSAAGAPSPEPTSDTEVHGLSLKSEEDEERDRDRCDKEAETKNVSSFEYNHTESKI
ncbi:hypothetical protein ACFX13_013531 [Malus domestica]